MTDAPTLNIISAVLFSSHFSTSLYWGAQTGTQHSRCASPVLSRREDHLPQPTGNILPNTVKKAFGCLCHKGMLLVHVQVVCQDSQMLLCRATFQLASTQPILVHGINLPQLQDLVLNIIWLHEIPVCSFLQPVNTSLNAYTATWHIRCISCIWSFQQSYKFIEECTSLS